MLTLRIQAFLAFLGFAVLLLLGVFIYSSLSFEKSFETYILHRENERNAELIESLKQYYESEGSFEYFKNNPESWEAFHQVRRSGERFPPRPTNATQEAYLHPADRPTPRGPRRDFRTRYLLLDESKNLIAGNRSNRDQYVSTEISLHTNGGKRVIGYISMPVNRVLRDIADLQFVDQQKNHFTKMTLFALVAAFAFAIPLALLLTRKLKRITHHVENLGRGEYSHKISLNGRDEISLLAEQLNHLGQTLADSETSRKRFVADISHELRTPLAVLKADLEAMEDGIRPLTRESIKRLQTHTHRLQHLINDLYELSLSDIGAMTYRKSWCDLTSLTQSVLTSFMQEAKDMDIALTFASPENPLTLFADESRLQQLVANLLSNSLKYTHAPGSIHLHIEALPNIARITLEDSAPSVNMDELERIFDRLYRGDASRNRATGGAGLGLSICKNIVTAHNGTIYASPSDLGGLKIIIDLPLAATHA